MSLSSARFFSYVQEAAFYSELHRKAVALLPPGSGETWFDVGCGPGLVTRLTDARGYQATGFDIDESMVTQARLNAAHGSSSSRYELAGVEELIASGRKAKVISAASLLIVLNDPEKVLRQLLTCLDDDGTLLVIETTTQIKPSAAWNWLKKNGWSDRNWVLLLWSWVRSNARAVAPSEMHLPGYRIERADILDGLVTTWLIRRIHNSE